MISTLGLWFLVAGYAFMVAFFIIQRFLRLTKRAKSFKRGSFDRGSSFLIWMAVGVGLWLPLMLDSLGFSLFSIDLLEGSIALAVMLSGLGLRIWAAITLGKYYSTTLTIAEDHRVITAGPYSRIRHPGYLSEILMWSGFGVLSSNLVIAVLVPVIFVIVLLYRMSAEETMLVGELGDDYVRYQQRTRKLVPYVY